ncbi:cytochrome P450 4V2 [Caerostris extrusa]|uniref:Cytochrome P450 4V2 n=1 Tax=Caerostris extrusa TaxID=172846 RepID=A0AAV4N5V8_CAEEX|nr:cytochrome P450 4V2 [Caerostris extrusa]
MFALFSWGVGIVFCVYLLLRRVHQNRRRAFRGVGGVAPIWVIGNVARLARAYSKKLPHHPGVYILQGIIGVNSLFYKDGVQLFWMGLFPVASVFKPELVEIILSSNTSLDKSYEYSYLHRWLGRGLLTSTGARWRSRRKLLTPSFHFRILEDFLPTFNDVSLVLVEKLRAQRHRDYVDLMPLVVLCTLDMVCETVMGVNIGAQSGENPEYVTAVHNLGDNLVERIARPLLWPDFLFNLSKTGRCFNRDLAILHGFTEKVIKDKKASLLSGEGAGMGGEEEEARLGGKRRQALMDLLLDVHVKDQQQITEQDIQEEVDTFMFEVL